VNQGRTVFSQFLSFLPDCEFRRYVERYGGDGRPAGTNDSGDDTLWRALVRGSSANSSSSPSWPSATWHDAEFLPERVNQKRPGYAESHGRRSRMHRHGPRLQDFRPYAASRTQ
jgi:hypothetical protein